MVLFIFRERRIQKFLFLLAGPGAMQQILFLQFTQALVNLPPLFGFEFGQFRKDFRVAHSA